MAKRSEMIRQAAALPQGDPKRREILASLLRQSRQVVKKKIIESPAAVWLEADVHANGSYTVTVTDNNHSWIHILTVDERGRAKFRSET